MNSLIRFRGVIKVVLAVFTLIVLVVGWDFLGSYTVTIGTIALMSARVLFILGFIGLIVSAAYDLRRNKSTSQDNTNDYR